MSTETIDVQIVKGTDQLASARTVRRMGWLKSLFMFIFGWMWRKRRARPIEGRPIPQPLPEPAAAAPAPKPLQRKVDQAHVARGLELLKIVEGHPETGCGKLSCTVVQDLRVFMGKNGIIPDDLGTDLQTLKNTLRRVPIAHARGYMERALSGRFDRFSTSRIDRLIDDDRLTAAELGTTPQLIDKVRRAENIDTCMTFLGGLRMGTISLERVRDTMQRLGVTAEDLGTTEQEFELYA